VEEMSVLLEESKKKVAKLQRECEEYLVVIVQQRQEANDQAKQISAKSEKIEAEENEVKQEGTSFLLFLLFLPLTK
jgi:dynein heavy chain, axonemal